MFEDYEKKLHNFDERLYESLYTAHKSYHRLNNADGHKSTFGEIIDMLDYNYLYDDVPPDDDTEQW